jgi:hypothetical protein
LDDLQPGDVFRFKRGRSDNIYIMGSEGNHFHVNGATEYLNGSPYGASPFVLLYPDAELMLGTPVETKAERDGQHED